MASITSLLASAASTRESIQDYTDKLMAAEYGQSAYTDSAFSKYQAYLTKRINELTAAGGISNASKALSLTNTLNSARRSNVSATISRVSDQVLYGGAPLSTKASVLEVQYERAVSNGDYTLAQRLAGDYYSVSQSIQQQQEQAVKDQQSLNKANESAIKKGYSDAIGMIKDKVIDTLALIQNGADSTAAIKSMNKELGSTLKELTGKGLPSGSEANLGSVLQAYFNAEFAYNQKASSALRPYDPSAADQFAQYDADGNLVGGKAYSIMANQAYVKVPDIGNVNAWDARNYAMNPNLLGVSHDENGKLKFYKNQITGFMPNGVPIADQTRAQDMLTTDVKATQKRLENLGFGNIKVNEDGTVTASFTDKTDKWIGYGGKNKQFLSSSGFGRGNEVTLIPQANGSFQFENNHRVFNVALDSKGLGGLFETGLNGMNTHLAGQYGFNNKVNTLLQNANIERLQVAEREAKVNAANVSLQNTLKAAKIPAASLYGTATSKSPNAQFLPAVTSTQPKPKGPTMSQRAGGGFNFTNANGQAISAATYAQLTKTAFRSVLQRMANAGDAGAKAALNFVGNDYGYDPNKVKAGSSSAKLYNALVWGTGRSAPVNAPNIQSGKLTLPSGFQL